MRIGSVRRISAVDAHTAGGLVRLIVSGLPSTEGVTMAERADAFSRTAERRCNAVARSPRGMRGLTMAILTPPEQEHSDAGVLFRRHDRFLPISGEGLIAVATIALERGLIHPSRAGVLQFDTESGTVPVMWDLSDPPDEIRVRRVRLVGSNGYVLAPGLPLSVASRSLRADVAFAGEWFALVDAESAGVPLTATRGPVIEDAGRVVADAVRESLKAAFPDHESHRRLAGVLFTGPAQDTDRCLRGALVRSDGTVEPWPSPTGLCAILSVLTAMGLVGAGDSLQLEGLIGTRIVARVVGVAAPPSSGVVVEVEGTAWITATHEFVLNPDDPLRDGVGG